MLVHRRDIFLSTLQHLRERHKGLVTYGKSWQQSKAKASEKSIIALTASVQSQRRNNAASSFLLMTAFVAVILLYLSRQESFRVSPAADTGIALATIVLTGKHESPPLVKLGVPLLSLCRKKQQQHPCIHPFWMRWVHG